MAAITFDRCVIHVFDWNHSIAFYRDALEAEMVPLRPGAVFQFGLVQLNTYGPEQIGVVQARLPVISGGSESCFEWHDTFADA
jgi:hypothetical protein